MCCFRRYFVHISTAHHFNQSSELFLKIIQKFLNQYQNIEILIKFTFSFLDIVDKQMRNPNIASV